MKIATQADIDAFLSRIMLNEEFYPYLSAACFFSGWKVPESDWHGVYLTDDQLSYFLMVDFDRSKGMVEFDVCLYSLSPASTIKALIAMRYLIKRYRPKAINSVVHASNTKSLELHKRIMGEPWGIKPLAAWNSGLGKLEDLHCFRKLF